MAVVVPASIHKGDCDIDCPWTALSDKSTGLLFTVGGLPRSSVRLIFEALVARDSETAEPNVPTMAAISSASKAEKPASAFELTTSPSAPEAEFAKHESCRAKPGSC